MDDPDQLADALHKFVIFSRYPSAHTPPTSSNSRFTQGFRRHDRCHSSLVFRNDCFDQEFAMTRVTALGLLITCVLAPNVYGQQMLGGCPVLPANNIWNTP